jgi:hypothetical protein
VEIAGLRIWSSPLTRSSMCPDMRSFSISGSRWSVPTRQAQFKSYYSQSILVGRNCGLTTYSDKRIYLPSRKSSERTFTERHIAVQQKKSPASSATSTNRIKKNIDNSPSMSGYWWKATWRIESVSKMVNISLTFRIDLSSKIGLKP